MSEVSEPRQITSIDRGSSDLYEQRRTSSMTDDDETLVGESLPLYQEHADTVRLPAYRERARPPASREHVRSSAYHERLLEDNNYYYYLPHVFF